MNFVLREAFTIIPKESPDPKDVEPHVNKASAKIQPGTPLNAEGTKLYYKNAPHKS
jgi:hypothetical protein